jgi:hypothetical protein
MVDADGCSYGRWGDGGTVMGEKRAVGEKDVAGIVQRLGDVDILEAARGRESKGLARKTSRASSRSPRKLSPTKSSQSSQRFEPFQVKMGVGADLGVWEMIINTDCDVASYQ